MHVLKPLKKKLLQFRRSARVRNLFPDKHESRTIKQLNPQRINAIYTHIEGRLAIPVCQQHSPSRMNTGSFRARKPGASAVAASTGKIRSQISSNKRFDMNPRLRARHRTIIWSAKSNARVVIRNFILRGYDLSAAIS